MSESFDAADNNGAGEVRDTSPAETESEFIDLSEVDLENEVTDAVAELAERTADLQRLTAEYANYRRRVERDRVTVVENAKASVVTELLGVLDDLDRARAHGDLEAGPLKAVADKLSDALTKQGLAEFGVVGESFDPTLHEAVQHEGEGRNPVIGTVLRKGYRLGERVLRHALVGVTDGDLSSVQSGDDGLGDRSDSGPNDTQQ